MRKQVSYRIYVRTVDFADFQRRMRRSHHSVVALTIANDYNLLVFVVKEK